jgi:hypothetical protein
MIQCIDHVNIVVSDLSKARDLFSLLGFPEDLIIKARCGWTWKKTGHHCCREWPIKRSQLCTLYRDCPKYFPNKSSAERNTHR